MQVEPYLNFDGRCEEALEFYQRALGAEVLRLLRFKDGPEVVGRPATDGPFAETKEVTMAPPPGAENKVMHASFRIGDSIVMASDAKCTGKPAFHGVTLSLKVANEAQAKQAFAALADGGQVQMPLMKTFFSPNFGMVADRFGVSWMVVVQP